jgi:hypothetical protein
MTRVHQWLAPAVAALWLSAIPVTVTAHHSVAGFFDSGEQVEIEGTVSVARWRNPHTMFEVEVTGPSGETTTWKIESGALGVLRTRGLAREFVQVGDRVRIMGDASLRFDNEMFARNMLLSNGKEVMLTAGSSPYFSVREDGGLLEASYDEEVTAAARRSADGIFRVWSTNLQQRPSAGGRLFHGDYPLTSEAESIRATYDAGAEVLLGCTEWSMPRLMSNPLPMEFAREGDTILQRFEEDDNVRVIHMAEGSSADQPVQLALGYSTGRWDGDSLVIETSNIAPERLDNLGTPFGARLHLMERFTPVDGGARLSYSLTISDPDFFTETFTLQRYWEWRPEIVVGRYDCAQDQELSGASAQRN